MAAQQLLDQVQGLAALEAFVPASYHDRLADELAGDGSALAGLEAWDDQLRAALAAIEGFVQRAMRIRLEHELAGDLVVAAPLRKVLAATVTAYADDLERLRARVADSAGRVAPGAATAAAAIVVDAARRVLELGAELQGGVLELARRQATAWLPGARQRARDRRLDDDVRRRWTAVGRVLEELGAHPASLVGARFADRVRAHLPAEAEPLEEAPEPTLGELIEPY